MRGVLPRDKAASARGRQAGGEKVRGLFPWRRVPGLVKVNRLVSENAGAGASGCGLAQMSRPPGGGLLGFSRGGGGCGVFGLPGGKGRVAGPSG